MGIYTNEGLVRHAEKALALRTKYMWGGILRPIEQLYDMLFRMYGNKPGTGYTAARWNELSKLRNKGYFGVDCVGLVKSYYWSGKPDGGAGSPKYGAAGFPDVNAGGMYAAAKIKGGIETLPETPGIILISRKAGNHIGIYVGNGETIESTFGSRGDGVVRHKLDKNFWTDWFECPYIKYLSSTMATAEIKKCTLVFPANVRSEPAEKGKKIGRYKKGSTVTIVVGSETKDSDTGYVYVRISGSREAWIVKSAIK